MREDDRGLLSSPWTIAVGGITLGGAGKSEVVLFLARQFNQDGFKVAILAHGYRANSSLRSTPQPIPTLIHRSTNARDKVSWYGDEAMMMRARLPPQVDVWIGGTWRQRWEAARVAKAELIICDGGLYHTALPRHWNLCVVDARVKSSLIPFGSWTRPISSLPPPPRCWIWLHGSSAQNSLPELLPSIPLFRSEYIPDSLWGPTGESIPLEELQDRSIYTLAAIAQPYIFYKMLDDLGAHRVGGYEARDHSTFAKKIIQKLPMITHSHPHSPSQRAPWYITTEKDRLKFPKNASVYVFRVHLKLSPPQRSPSHLSSPPI